MSTWVEKVMIMTILYGDVLIYVIKILHKNITLVVPNLLWSVKGFCNGYGMKGERIEGRYLILCGQTNLAEEEVYGSWYENKVPSQ